MFDNGTMNFPDRSLLVLFATSVFICNISFRATDDSLSAPLKVSYKID